VNGKAILRAITNGLRKINNRIRILLWLDDRRSSLANFWRESKQIEIFSVKAEKFLSQAARHIFSFGLVDRIQIFVCSCSMPQNIHAIQQRSFSCSGMIFRLILSVPESAPSSCANGSIHIWRLEVTKACEQLSKS
jgi:hypothetical protein